MVLTAVPKSIGFIYAIAMILLLGYLWHSGRWKKKMGWLLLITTAALGFLIFSPVAPWQFQQLVLRNVQGLGAPLVAGAVGLMIVLLLTVVFGRFFCGYLCPVGAVQEIAYLAPVPKVRPSQEDTVSGHQGDCISCIPLHGLCAFRIPAGMVRDT